MHDPYTPTRYASDAVRTEDVVSAAVGMQWWRIFIGGLVLFVVLTTWHTVAAFLTSMLAIEAVLDRGEFGSATIVRMIADFLFATFAYWAFSASIRRWRLLHVLLACGWAQAMGGALLWILVDRSLDYRGWNYWVPVVMPVLAGWALTRWWPGRSNPPLRFRR
ncbi:hypothetical protein [Pseudoxanthomonas sp. PXM02]|uniref:hypothetical protein n=1 Tax=Pseudoxanthomonas sp. PXM02 TaxID=2769294 RepID=UPI00177A91C5|nr:hypothetical protein [Pseudoxanthomonas sp. PXM02]MBD9479923.1 hypothetical protein [Pseudoxanthomonas sp. PXM02]